jgi:hypothetical protein
MTNVDIFYKEINWCYINYVIIIKKFKIMYIKLINCFVKKNNN